jgi:murein DD-endopeptidase MepM/ murein hydrolase activator NlpD
MYMAPPSFMSPPAYLPPPPTVVYPQRPAIFDHHPRRPSTAAAIEPPRFSRFPRPRTSAGRVATLAVAAAGLAAIIVSVAGYQIWSGQQPRGKQTAVLADDPHRPETEEERVTRIAMSAQESQRVLHRTTAQYRDLWRSTVWYHPLTDEVFLPENKTRKFGARRHGDRPSECGRGHCGVDIGFFGLSVRAAQDGVVEVVQRHSRDNAGRYVRILHDSGFVSYYIHLNSIRPDLEVGMRVKGGEPIGITGKTGIKRSRPHLHFQLAFRDGHKQYFIDPEPLLRRAVTADDEQVPAEQHAATAGDEHAELSRSLSPAM